MPTVTTSDGYSYKIPLQLPHSVVADKFVSGDGKTSLDVTNNHIDETHLLLHGDLDASHSYIRCEKTNGSIPFNVDSQGITSVKDLKTDSHTSLNSMLSTISASHNQTNSVALANETILDAASVSHVNDTLVKRSNDGSATVISLLKVNQIQSVAPNPDISVYGAGAITYVPQDQNYNNITGKYRFGKNVDLLNSYDQEGPGDGLYMERNSNIFQCEVPENAPTVVIKGSKSANVDYFLILDNNDNVLFSVDRNGDMPGKHHLTDAPDDIPDREGNAGIVRGA